MTLNEKEKELQKRIQSIGPTDKEAEAAAEARQAQLMKVPGSLGTLEDISIRLAGITGKATGNDLTKQCIAIFCADNGVVAEGVAVAPQEVTLKQTMNFPRRITGVSSQASYFGIDLLVVDVGVKLPIPKEAYTDSMLDADGKISVPIVNRRLADGTRDLAIEPAMTREQAVDAMLIGFEAADAMAKAGIRLAGIGEMGIGNTTTSSAILCALTGIPSDRLVGRGGGLNNEGLAAKIRIVGEAGKRCSGMEPLEILRNVGGFDLAAMTAAYLGLASHHIPVVIDGFISVAAACLAQAFNPEVTGYLFASHISTEIGYKAAIEKLGLKPMFDLGMRLGEGSGCPVAFKTIEAAGAVIDRMKTFDECALDTGYMEEVNRENFY
ncbi:MAG: nicotinate-nucleotide--dimethylbenzimidazole phosphoribosyltransferase [Anaerovoracaceae bacterium]